MKSLWIFIREFEWLDWVAVAIVLAGIWVAFHGLALRHP